MSVSPKPITITQVAEDDYEGPAPQPFAVVGAIGPFSQGDAVADVSTADGSDAATTQALANALKAKINALLAELRQAGVIDT